MNFELWTSKEAEAPKEEVAKGLESVVALTISIVLLTITWDILLIFNNGVTPTAKRGKSIEKDVYLKQIKSNSQLAKAECTTSSLNYKSLLLLNIETNNTLMDHDSISCQLIFWEKKPNM